MAAGEKIAPRALGKLAEQVRAPAQSVGLVMFSRLPLEQSAPVPAHITLYPHAAGEQGQLDVFGDEALFASDRLPVLRDCDGRSVEYPITCRSRGAEPSGESSSSSG